ncbi:DedA family protein [Amycolatopsis taiwanensis]|uniref:Membrane protein n=1 Tax=Amycolatopsis taiwanensis TaxID=342230 RepID=A0A9W6VIG4_9PSEU|nr:membrane protein [Amycolatopsis taiwanensis]
MSALALDWSNTSSAGYPTLFAGVLIGSIVPIVPTGALVGAAAAVAMTTSHLSLPLVLLLSVLGAAIGDVVTYLIARAGSEAAIRRLVRGQRPDRLINARERFAKHGWQLVVIGRLVPAGRIPVLVAAGAVAYPWRRLLAATAIACVLWALAYAVLGIVSGGIFDSPLVATLIATVLVLVVTGAVQLVAKRRERRKS